MIEYIIISYVFMFMFAVWRVVVWDDYIKTHFKLWVFSPLTLPLTVISAFIFW